MGVHPAYAWHAISEQQHADYLVGSYQGGEKLGALDRCDDTVEPARSRWGPIARNTGGRWPIRTAPIGPPTTACSKLARTERYRSEPSAFRRLAEPSTAG